jgi:proteasome assembly chaperone 2
MHLGEITWRKMEFISLDPLSKDIRDLAGSNWTLVLPAVTVGNVGQLAVDLVLTNASCVHVGRLRAPAVLPVAGAASPPPVHRSPLLSALELYVVSGGPDSIVLLQQRSPIAPGRAREHAQALLDWAIQAGCSQILVLASANAAGRRDAQLRIAPSSVSARLRVAGSTFAFEGEGLAARTRNDLQWKSVEGPDPRGWVAESQAVIDDDQQRGFPAFLPTSRPGAFVHSILECSEATNFPTTALLIFVHEGDNTGDAVVMASAALVLLGLQLGRRAETTDRVADGAEEDPVMRACSLWDVPPLWKTLFAPPPPRGLY